MFLTSKFYIMCGSSSSGKSYLLVYLLNHFLSAKKLKFGLVFTRTKHNGAYSFLPDYCVQDQWDMQMITRYLASLKEFAAEHKCAIPPNFIVIDDMVSMVDQQSREWLNFICTFRHFNITLFLTTQAINRLQPTAREQANFVFIFAQHTDQCISKLFENYGALLGNKKKFAAFIAEHTREKYSTVCWFENSDNVIAEKYKRFKAPASYKLGKYKF